MSTVLVLVALLTAVNLTAYFSLSYFLYLFVKAKRKENFEGLAGWKRAGIFLVLPIVTVGLAVYHKLFLTREKDSDDSKE